MKLIRILAWRQWLPVELALWLTIAALCSIPEPAHAQANFPTAASGVRAPGTVPLQCNSSGAACSPVTQANPLPVNPGTALPPLKNGQGIVAGGPSYSAAQFGLTAYATPTDVFSIRNPAGSGKIIQVRFMILLMQSTAGTLVTWKWYRRVSLDTGGSPTALTPFQYDSADAAPVAVVQAYTAAPTIVDGAAPLMFPHIGNTAAVTAAPTTFNTNGSVGQPSNVSTDMMEPITVRPGQELTANFSGAAWPAGGTFVGIAVWTENPIPVSWMDALRRVPPPANDNAGFAEAA